MNKFTNSEVALNVILETLEEYGEIYFLVKERLLISGFELKKEYVTDHIQIFKVTPKPSNMNQVSFSAALEAAKDGKRIARLGWNGANMYAYIVPANSYPAQTEHARREFGDMVPYRAYWALKTAQNDVATWAPSGSDTLAEDWIILE